MSRHVMFEELQRLRSGQLPAADVLRITAHLGDCQQCREDAGRQIALTRAVSEWRAGFLEPEGEHPAHEELVALVGGLVGGYGRAELEEHLLSCSRCRDDAADLRPLARREVVPQRLRALSAGLAASLASVAGLFWWQVRQPVPAPQRTAHSVPTISRSEIRRYGRADWDDLVRVSLRDGMSRPTLLDELHPAGDTLRGPSVKAEFANEPAGTAVISQRPRFTWNARPGRYRVEIFEGDKLVQRSPILTATTWTPPILLRRGHSFVWQVSMLDDDGSVVEVQPSPPLPPATVHVVSTSELAELDDADRRFPDDHLLAGLLAARYGLFDRAEAELATYRSHNPGPAADRLYDAARSWCRHR